MAGPHDHGRRPGPDGGHGGHRGHGWMMIACCIPMLAIALALLATGVVGPGFLVAAVVCTLLMAFLMHGGHDAGDEPRDPPDMLHKHGSGGR